jgi:ABC-type nitrate/sulfonate/bicarbonate transport system permease component
VSTASKDRPSLESVRVDLVEPHAGESGILRQAQDESGLGRSIAEKAASFVAGAFPPAVLLGLLLLAWETYVAVSGINPVTLPAPSQILDAGWANRATLFDHSLVTLREALVGMSASVVFGVAMALLIDAFAPARRTLYPLLVGSQTIPIVVIAPLLILWFGFDLTPKVLVVTLYTFFPITVAFAAGLAAADREALLLMRTLGAGWRQTLLLLKLPQALPYLFTGLRIAVTYAIVGAVFAEWSGAREGLGIFILLMKNSFRTDMVFAAIFLVSLLSLALFAMVTMIEKLVVRWR